MNFLLRTAYPVAPEPSVGNEHKDTVAASDEGTTLQGLIGEYSNSKSSSSEEGEREDDGGVAKAVNDPNVKSRLLSGSHSDVMDEEGWITIPYKKLPEEWNCAPDAQSLRSLDRSFIFLGEQIHILACLATSKQDMEVITPFKMAAAISKGYNTKQSTNNEKERSASNSSAADPNGDSYSTLSQNVENGKLQPTDGNGAEENISATESLIRMENQKEKIELLLERLKNSHFFVRISDSDEPLWSRKGNAARGDAGSGKALSGDHSVHAVIDRGNYDGNSSGGMARNSARCYSLSNGDIVVLLQVNVGTGAIKNPVLEVLQFEQFPPSSALSKSNHFSEVQDDPYGELLTWLHPLDRTLPPRLSPILSSSPGVTGASHRPTLSASGSQIFSFGHFRSYSMPSIPQTSIPSSISPATTKSSFDLEDFHDSGTEKPIAGQEVGTGPLSSFRGIPLEPEKYSVQCGLGGIYLPGKRWRRKVEIIQPVEIHTFAYDCNTEDLLCVQIKNVSPAHLPDIVIFLDSINIVFDEAPKDGPPLCIPVTCIEAGSGHSIPNLALRRGEEHSFLLKPAAASFKDHKSARGKGSLLMPSHAGFSVGLSTIATAKAGDRTFTSNTGHYAVLVSCRCNYTESKLFFKKPTKWQPRIRKDLMISVASEISSQSSRPEGKRSQLPVQTLTLEASNLTTEDMTLTVLAPASLTAPPSVVSLSSAPTSPVSPFVGFPEFAERGSSMQRLSSMPVQDSQKESDSSGTRSISLTDRATVVPETLPNSELGCTHLWLQSTVPLGCIPANSSSTVKLELLPLTDGIITLDTLQIAVKEKGLTYVPEHSLKIHATSSLATGIM